MKYFASYDPSGRLVCIGAGIRGVEITQEEYDRLLAEIREKEALVNRLYGGEITIESVPAEWQGEIQRRVNERVEREAAAGPAEIDGEEFMSMVEEVL